MTRYMLAPIVALGLLFAPATADAKGKLVNKLAGSWQLVSMTKGGKTEQMPAGMSITLTFKKGGAYSLEMSAQGQKRAQAGKYWVKKGKLHITAGNGRMGKDGKPKIEIVTVRFAKKGTVILMTKGDETVRAVRVKTKPAGKTTKRKG